MNRAIVPARRHHRAEVAARRAGPGQVIARDPVAGLRIRLVVRPRPAAQLGERPSRRIAVDVDIGVIDRPASVPRPLQQRCRDRLHRRRAPARQLDVGQPADETHVGWIRQLIVRVAHPQLGRPTEPLAHVARDEVIDRVHVGRKEGSETERALEHGSVPPSGPGERNNWGKGPDTPSGQWTESGEAPPVTGGAVGR